MHRWLPLAQKEEVLDILSRAIANLSRVLEPEIPDTSLPAASNPVRFIYRHMHWLHHDLVTQNGLTISGFVQTHLQ
jgi:predicted translin family RNA/ssDNA-binding protein